MKWIKASERLPTRDWPHCIRYDGGGAPYYVTMLPNELIAALQPNDNPEQYTEDYEWLDESPDTIQTQAEIDLTEIINKAKSILAAKPHEVKDERLYWEKEEDKKHDEPTDRDREMEKDNRITELEKENAIYREVLVKEGEWLYRQGKINAGQLAMIKVNLK